MTFDSPISKKTLSGIVGVAAIIFYLWLLTWSAPVKAMPGVMAAPEGAGNEVVDARIFKRDRTPIYPYAYNPAGPRGWSTYFGFVPYSKGNIEQQALQRSLYPQNTWPHDPNAPYPDPYGVEN